MSVHVAVGVVADRQGRILLTRRHAGAHQGGLWEFPGGKLEPGEPLSRGLARELEEELDIRVHASEPLIRIPHDYGDKRVVLDVHRVTAWSGTPRGREGQPMRWVAVDDLGHVAFPAANRPIVAALQLPARYLITPDAVDYTDERFLAAVATALDRGVRLFQFRSHRIDEARYEALGTRLAHQCRVAGALLIANTRPELARAIGAHGVHLPGWRLADARWERDAVAGWLGVSCHDAAGLERAVSAGADFAVLSPVNPTASHPERAALGWDGFAALVHEAPLPVYALGGLEESDLPRARACGAQGIAGISGLWPEV